MAIPAKLQEHIETLAMFPDRQERIDMLIGMGEEYKNFSPDDVVRDDSCKVPGCESEVFLGTEPLGEGLRFKFAVDNPQGISAMALAQILDTGLSGAPLDQVAQVPEEIVFDIFGRELSMGKSLGLTNMVKMVKAVAQSNRA